MPQKFSVHRSTVHTRIRVQSLLMLGLVLLAAKRLNVDTDATKHYLALSYCYVCSKILPVQNTAFLQIVYLMFHIWL